METDWEQRRTIEDLGDDVMMEILCSLPLNSMTRCRDVCKRWRYLLTRSPLFRTKPVNVVVASYSHCDHTYMWVERDQGGMQISELDFSVDVPRKRSYDHCILASCNGLLLSYYFPKGMADLGEFYISNPWTKEFVHLPKPAKSCYNSLCGLAFESNPINSNSMDNNNKNNNVALYKIVMAYEHEIYRPTTYKFEIYSSDKRRWQLLNGPSEQHLCPGKLVQNGVYCNQVLYWLCNEKDHALMFNLETETSGYLDLPSNNNELPRYVARRLMECNRQLHCVQISLAYRRLSVWKMSTATSSEWLILHNVDLLGAMDRNLNLYPMWRTKQIFPVFNIIDMGCQGDDKVLLEDDYYRIVSYDLKRDVFELVLLKIYVPPAADWNFFRYTPTSSCLEREVKLCHMLQNLNMFGLF